MTTFVVRPEHDGPHPVVLYLMDAPSIRPALSDMASRLATAGYYVLMPYLYHRVGPYQRWDEDDSFMHKRFDLMGSIVLLTANVPLVSSLPNQCLDNVLNHLIRRQLDVQRQRIARLFQCFKLAR